MTKRAQQISALLLSLTMAASTLTSTASALDYEAATGTVHVDGNLSWQENHETYMNRENAYNHEEEDDKVLNIKNDSGEETSSTVIKGNVNTELNITISGVTQSGENDAVNITTGANGEVDLTISGSTLEGNVTVNNTNGSTSVEVNGDSNVTISNSTIVGNKVTIDKGGNYDVSGTGLQVSDNSNVTISGTTTITGSNVTVNTTDKADVNLSGNATGVELSGNSTVTVDGILSAYGEQGSYTAPSIKDDVNKTGVSASGNSAVDVKGDMLADDYKESTNYGATVYEKDSAGTYVMTEKGDYCLASSVDTSKTYAVVGTSKKQVYFDADKGQYYYKVGQTKNYFEEDPQLYWRKGTTSTYVPCTEDRYTKGEYRKDRENTGTNTGIAINDAASLNVDSNLVAPSLTVSENGNVTVTGLLYAEMIQKGGMDNTDEAYKTFTVNGVGVHVAGYDKDADTIVLYYDVPANYNEKELTIDIAKYLDDTMNAKWTVKYSSWYRGDAQPGDHFNFNLKLVNKSGNTYTYTGGSLNLDRADAPEGDYSWLSARCPNEAILKLLGKENEVDVTVDDLANLSQTLNEKGYDSLEAYYLEYINQKYGTKYTSLAKADPQQVIAVTNSFRNAQYTVSNEKYEELLEMAKTDGTFEVYVVTEYEDGSKWIQLKEESGSLAAIDRFYDELLGIGIGNTVNESIANNKNEGEKTPTPLADREYNTIGDFHKDETLKEKYEAYLQQQFGGEQGVSAGEMAEYLSYFLINGPYTGNEIQALNFGWTNAIVLSRVDTDPGEDPTTPPTTPTTPPTEDPVEVPEGDIPLGDLPEEVEIPDEDTPLGELPEELEIEDEETPLGELPEELEIEDEEIPLGELPQTGAEWAPALALGALGLGLCAMGALTLKKKENA